MISRSPTLPRALLFVPSLNRLSLPFRRAMMAYAATESVLVPPTGVVGVLVGNTLPCCFSAAAATREWEDSPILSSRMFC